ncbi:MAG: hypothetical protein IPK52_13590 [Chloroflexi bacterium]|nr:hypothetical protein [Chloroflexota bacterium]
MERDGPLARAVAQAPARTGFRCSDVERPINEGENRYNEGFIWDAENGYRAAHRKAYLPDEEGFWEASWYQRGPRTYTSLEAHGARIGFLICTEMWFNEHARAYGKQGAHLIVTSRMTEPATLGKWMTGGRGGGGRQRRLSRLVDALRDTPGWRSRVGHCAGRRCGRAHQ